MRRGDEGSEQQRRFVMDTMTASAAVEERAEETGQADSVAGVAGDASDEGAREVSRHEEHSEAEAEVSGDEEKAVLHEIAGEAQWRERVEAAEGRSAVMADRLAAVEAAAEDLRRIVGESERARQVDRELLIAGVVDLDAARELVDAQVREGATVLEAVSRVRERKPLLFAGGGRGGAGGGIRATSLPAAERHGPGRLGDVAEAARETGDRRLLLRYLRMRRGGN